MSTRRPGTCGEPGPYAAHCTNDAGPLHRYSCYDAGEDVSWNEGQWYDFDLAPHDCGDPGCPDLGYRGPKGRESEHGRDDELASEPEREISDRAADAILGLVETDRQLRGDQQTWERRLGGTDVAEVRIHLEVDERGRAHVHGALLAQLLVDAGWERTA